MTRQGKVLVGTGVGAVLMGLVFAAAAKASGTKPKQVPKSGCADDEIPNVMRAQYVAKMASQKRQPNAVELAKFPLCMKRECPPGHVRDQYGRCVESPASPTFCPAGQHWDAKSQTCVTDTPSSCPPGKMWSEGLQMCIDVVEPVVPLIPDEPPPIRDYPEGGAFYQVQYGDIFGWGLAGKNTKAISQNLLARELLLAAREYGELLNDEALAFSIAHRINSAATNRIVDEILCSGMNDACYGTWGYCGDVAINNGTCRSTERNHPGKHGRAIRLLKQHADNKLRLEQNLPMARTVDILTSKQKGNGKSHAVRPASPGGDTSYPLLWMPKIDRKRLWESGGKDVQFVEGGGNPPDAITDRGVTDYSGSTLTIYGCAPNQLEFA